MQLTCKCLDCLSPFSIKLLSSTDSSFKAETRKSMTKICSVDAFLEEKKCKAIVCGLMGKFMLARDGYSRPAPRSTTGSPVRFNPDCV